MPWKHLDVRKTVRGPRQRPSSDVRHAAGGVAEAGGSHSARAVTFRPSPWAPRARSSGRRGPRGPSQGPDAHAGQLADVSSGPLALCPSGPGSRGQNSQAPLMEGSVLGSTPGRPPSLATGCLASQGTGGGAAGPQRWNRVSLDGRPKPTSSLEKAGRGISGHSFRLVTEDSIGPGNGGSWEIPWEQRSREWSAGVHVLSRGLWCRRAPRVPGGHGQTA